MNHIPLLYDKVMYVSMCQGYNARECVSDLYHFCNICVKVPYDYCLIYGKMTKEQNYLIYLILQMKSMLINCP